MGIMIGRYWPSRSPSDRSLFSIRTYPIGSYSFGSCGNRPVKTGAILRRSNGSPFMARNSKTDWGFIDRFEELSSRRILTYHNGLSATQIIPVWVSICSLTVRVVSGRQIFIVAVPAAAVTNLSWGGTYLSPAAHICGALIWLSLPYVMRPMAVALALLFRFSLDFGWSTDLRGSRVFPHSPFWPAIRANPR